MTSKAKDASMKAKAVVKWMRRLKAGKSARGAARKRRREAFPKGRKIREVIDEETV